MLLETHLATHTLSCTCVCGAADVEDDAAAGGSTKPSIKLNAGQDLDEESSTDGPLPLPTQYDAPPGFQVRLICQCAFKDKLSE